MAEMEFILADTDFTAETPTEKVYDIEPVVTEDVKAEVTISE